MKRCIMIALMVLLMFPVLSWAMDVTLSWDANTEPDLAGYEIHYDIDSGDPYTGTDGKLQDGMPAPSPITMTFDQDENPDPGTVEFTAYGLPDGVNHFFAVKAFDTQGLKSGYSNEVNTDGEFPSTPEIGIKSITINQIQTIVIEGN